MTLVVLTGASGAGKTAISDLIAAEHGADIDIRFFDSIGVPPVEEMNALFGSPAGWQQAMTAEWMARIAGTMQPRRPVLFEGQMRIAFVVDAAAAMGLACHIILVDCDDATRRHRLASDRNQPELANDDMMNWAAFLRREAQSAGCEILDTSNLPIAEAAAIVLQRLRGS